MDRHVSTTVTESDFNRIEKLRMGRSIRTRADVVRELILIGLNTNRRRMD